jgi:hypothetical protein
MSRSWSHQNQGLRSPLMELGLLGLQPQKALSHTSGVPGLSSDLPNKPRFKRVQILEVSVNNVNDNPLALWRAVRGDKFKDRHLTELETFENLACQERDSNSIDATRVALESLSSEKRCGVRCSDDWAIWFSPRQCSVTYKYTYLRQRASTTSHLSATHDRTAHTAFHNYPRARCNNRSYRVDRYETVTCWEHSTGQL